MRQATRKGLMTVAAATGVIAAAGGQAQAHSGASGSASHSPGVLSGNTVQAPVHVPVNVCGNTVNVIGLLNPAAGNSCGRHSHDGPSDGHADSGGHDGSSGHGGAHAGGHTSDSPGVGSGNHVEVPVHAPVNVCGNNVSVVGIGNAAFGNDCANDDGGHTTPPGDGGGTPPPGTDPPETTPPGTDPPGTPPPGTPEQPGHPGDPGNPVEPGTPGTPPGTDGGTPGGDGPARLADTGSGLPVGAAASLGAGALLAGVVLYRRARASA
ncbi:chaplin [Streptomyces pharetrae]|jgi:hypothetical protein|uniref:chaplin n=1 Tax=Streptomyces pharetrae TaxID=291370 RepID=UPI00345F5375